MFSRFLNCTNGTKLRNAPHIIEKEIVIIIVFVLTAIFHVCMGWAASYEWLLSIYLSSKELRFADFLFFFQINYDHLISYFPGMTSGETTTNFEGSTFAELNTSMLSGWQNHSQPALTCSKLTIETLEQSVKYVQTKDTPMASFWCLYC